VTPANVLTVRIQRTCLNRKNLTEKMIQRYKYLMTPTGILKNQNKNVAIVKSPFV